MKTNPKIGINGFGRIGRILTRILIEKGIKIDFINDKYMPINIAKNLLDNDCVYGKTNFKTQIKKIRQNVLGFIIYNNRILLVKQKKANYWGFPKGGIEENESSDEALKRELFEETQITNFIFIKKSKHKLYFDLPEKFQKKGYFGKECTIFLVKVKNNKVTINKELSGYQWVKKEDLINILPYENLKELSKKLLTELKELKLEQ